MENGWKCWKVFISVLCKLEGNYFIEKINVCVGKKWEKCNL